MAGVSVEAAAGGRKQLDSEINMIPMIDLLMVTISFLLITAVWTHMARLDASAQVPGPPDSPPCEGAECTPPKQLHVDVRDPAHFTLAWKQGQQTLRSVEVPRVEQHAKSGDADVVRFVGLADAIRTEWAHEGAHREESDAARDLAVLHTADETPYATIVAVMDAVRAAERPAKIGAKVEKVPAFRVSFATN